MKKKDIIQLVKKLVKEDAYGSATLTTQGAPRTRAVAPAGKDPYTGRVEYPYTVGAKTKNGMMESQGTLASDMLNYADQYHMELVDTMKGVSTHPDKRTGGFKIVFPHYNGPDYTGAMFGKDVSMKIEKSKAAAKAAALKTVSKFQDQIEDYEITDKSRGGVHGSIHLFIIPKTMDENKEIEVLDDVEDIENLTINISEEDEMAPEVMAPRIKNIFNKVNGIQDPVQKPEFWKRRFKQMYGISFPENLKNVTKDQAIAMNRFGNDLKPYLKEIAPAVMAAVGRLAPIAARGAGTAARGAGTAARGTTAGGVGRGASSNWDKLQKTMDYVDTIQSMIPDDSDEELNELKNKLMKMKNEVTYIGKKGEMPSNLKPEDKVVIMDPEKGVKETTLKRPKKADLNKDGNLSSYEKTRGAAIEKAIKCPTCGATHKASSNLSEYIKERGDSNLMEHMDKYRKRALLMEGAMKRLFSMFDSGQTDEEIVRDHAQKGVEVPEAFISKIRKQWEGLKKMELELEMGETEFKNSARDIVNNPEGAETGMEPSMESKQLASGLFNESKKNKNKK